MRVIWVTERRRCTAMTFRKIICWFFGHDEGRRVFEKSFFSPSLDKLVDCTQSYCKRCNLSWPAEVYHRKTLYHRTIPIWISRIHNRFVFRKFRWTKKKQREYATFIKRQIKYFPEIYFGPVKAAELRRQALAKLTLEERSLFTEYDSNGLRV